VCREPVRQRRFVAVILHVQGGRDRGEHEARVVESVEPDEMNPVDKPVRDLMHDFDR
jgi:hypothetical protein